MDLMEVLQRIGAVVKWVSITWIAFGIATNAPQLFHLVGGAAPKQPLEIVLLTLTGYFVLPGGMGLVIAHLADTIN